MSKDTNNKSNKYLGRQIDCFQLLQFIYPSNSAI